MHDPTLTRHFPHLSVLALRSAGDAGDALLEIQAPIRRLTLDFDEVDDELEDSDEDPPDVFSLLPPFQETLDRLAVNNGWLEHVLGGEVYGRLFCLQMQNTFIPPVGRLVRAFPNLQRLEALFCFTNEDPDQFRVSNELSQLLGNTWRHLDVIAVHRPDFLYGLALGCTTRCIAFEIIDDRDEAEKAAELFAVLQPTSLRLGSRSIQGLREVLTPILAKAALSVFALHIIVDMALEGGQAPTVIDVSIDRVFAASSTMRLTHFMLTVCAPQVRNRSALSAQELHIRDYDLSELARRAMVIFPSLEFARFCFSRQDVSYWRVTRMSRPRTAQRQLEAISQAEGDIVTREIFPIPSHAEAAFFKE
ncbi:hypothetical protein BDW22DRAFT_215526 [Trametopsis cervina]|nr:hypothetical protein BDW22DRAFT_215526 [Trametopsis cervina]